MHSYPYVLVRAGNKKEAKKVCEDWINDHINDGPFDYGGPVDDVDDPECKTVAQYGEPIFLQVIKQCVAVEEASVQEHWDVVRQFVMKFAACKTPPNDARKFKVARVFAQGIEGLITAGQETSYSSTAHEGYLAMSQLHQMRKHMRYRSYMSTSDATLFVEADDIDIDALLAGKHEAKDLEELFLVRTNCHH